MDYQEEEDFYDEEAKSSYSLGFSDGLIKAKETARETGFKIGVHVI